MEEERMSLRSELQAAMGRISTPAKETRDLLVILGEWLGSTNAGNVGPHKTWYVDPTATGLPRDGKTWSRAFTTMTAAIAACSNGDWIMLTGRLTENIVIGTTPSNITVMGADYTIRDPLWSHDGESAEQVYVKAPGWTFQNIRFDYSNGYAGIKFDMDNANTWGYQGKVIDCSFQGVGATKPAIEFYGSPFLMEVINCKFEYITGVGGCAIGELAGGPGFAAPNRYTIAYNQFIECVNQISLEGANNCKFLHNIFQNVGHEHATIKHLYINLGNDNLMFGNFFGGDYSTDANSYKQSSGGGDSWIGNTAEDIAACPSGMTLAAPSAG